MDGYEYCHPFERANGELHVGYFGRKPAGGAGHRPRLVERLGLRSAPEPQADMTREAMRRLGHEGRLPVGGVPEAGADGAFERSYRRLTR